jgi:hypothetical protein
MTDDYKDCEDALITILQTLTTYFPEKWQVSDDDVVLTPSGKGSKGTAEYLIVYRPGAMPVARVSDRIKDYSWEVVLDLFVRYYNYKQAWAQFKAVRAAIIDIVNIHPTLNNTHGVRRVYIGAGGSPQYMLAPNADPYKPPDFVTQTLSVTVQQLVEYTGGEW